MGRSMKVGENFIFRKRESLTAKAMESPGKYVEDARTSYSGHMLPDIQTLILTLYSHHRLR